MDFRVCGPPGPYSPVLLNSALIASGNAIFRSGPNNIIHAFIRNTYWVCTDRIFNETIVEKIILEININNGVPKIGLEKIIHTIKTKIYFL